MIKKILFMVLMMLLMTSLAGTAANMQVTSSALPAMGGSIAPNGLKFFSGAATYTITVNAGWSISSILIDGVASAIATTKTIPFDTSKVHTIKVSFSQSTYSITTSAGPGGQIQITGGAGTNIAAGSNRAIIVSPSTGYRIQSYQVDGGTPVTPADPTVAATIPFNNITANHSVSAIFELIPVVTADAGADQTIGTDSNGAASTTLNGSATSNVGAFSCQWVVIDKPAGSTTSFGNGNSTTTVFNVDRIGIYKVSLSVTSGGVTVTSTPATITVLTPTQAASRTCTQCHAGQAQVVDWQASIHATSFSGASCPSCHMPNGEAHPGQNTSSMGNVCRNCHTDAQGNVPGHPFAIGTNPCVFCHNPHTTQASACDGCHDCPPATASHLKHFGGTVAQSRYGDIRITQSFGNYSSAYIFGCGNCHPMDVAKHGNGVVDVELNNPQATAGSIKALNPASAAYIAGNTVFVDAKGLPYTEGTCNNVYCHSYKEWTTTSAIPENDPNWQDKVVAVRKYRTVTWGGAPLACSGCHANPPQTSSPANDGGAGDSHSWIDPLGYQNLHTWNMGYAPISCKYCHNDTVKQLNTFTEDSMGIRTLGNVPISSYSKHVNGTNDVAFDRQNPFVYSSYGSGTIPMSLANATYDPATKNCSNVSCHIQQTTVPWGKPYRWYNYDSECDSCHGYAN
jgi:predicted CxxxxCH...CXXCH cytochrome family protein